MFNIKKFFKKKKLLIFDFDGVIVDSLQVIEEFDRWLYPDLTDDEWKDTHLGNHFAKMAIHEHKRVNATEEEISARREEFYENKNKSRIFPEMKECILHMPEDIICTINTSSKLGGCSSILENGGLLSRFSYLATKETSTSKKEKFQIILNKFKASVNDSLFITDTIGDLLEASDMGIRTICVTWGVHSRRDFSEYNPYKIVDTPSELDSSIKEFFVKSQERNIEAAYFKS
jgi:phosphoglycolate phosphatase